MRFEVSVVARYYSNGRVVQPEELLYKNAQCCPQFSVSMSTPVYDFAWVNGDIL